ncbi:uracil phosphoribosyltransferase [Marinigracilibium pacificum]|uniref:Uracil phosphoribosyltransferase n=1 Tax=Marinigracilibium pacificum TaxID=2729599 RepID=A0A848IW30_9BACT|nr:uracil phosphoribosyltransferase [Marinigracilibium pacificum]NMM48713.1 uracil phosphoribosyltransferase [Marinigracilibium pacificum]
MFVLTDQRSIADRFFGNLRNPLIQKNRPLFRANLSKVGALLAFEVSKKLHYMDYEIETTLGTAKGYKLSKPPVIITILRAGLPMLDGFMNMFDDADMGFIGEQRVEKDSEEITIKREYAALPDLTNRDVIVIDPMLATGKSMVEAVEHLSNFGSWQSLHISSVIAAPEGVKYLNANLPFAYSLYLGTIDDGLNDDSYIVPGLGDAGDLSFGPKT